MFRVFRKFGSSEPVFKRRSTPPQKSRDNINHPANGLMRLQKSLGNRFVQKLVHSGHIKAKLMIGKQSDPYEREADQVADRVMQMPEADVQRQAESDEEEEILQPQAVSKDIIPIVQKQDIDEDDEIQKQIEHASDEQIQAQEAEEEEEPVQSKETRNDRQRGTSNFSKRLQTLKGGGNPLPESVQTSFGNRFGHDFSDVRTHSGGEAADMARSINAKAFTSGKDIVFGAGQYSTESSQGKRLLAHELTHVVQQSGKRAIIQRTLAIDTKQFTGKDAAVRKNTFKKMILMELKAVTGLNLQFSGDQLTVRRGNVKGGSKTARTILNMAIQTKAKIYIDPMQKLGGEHDQRGIKISTKKLPIVLKTMRPGIVILHELAHHFSGKLKPPGYDKQIQSIYAKIAKGEKLTAEESELHMWARPKNIQADENIPLYVTNKIRDELGMIKRTHYALPLEYPPIPASSGQVKKITLYAQFEAVGNKPVYLYLNLSTWDLYSSTVDYFKIATKINKPAKPQKADFHKIIKGSKKYNAIKAQFV